MNKAYIIWPLVGLLVFGAFYWNFNQGYVEREKEKVRQVQREKDDRIRLDLERRRKAIEDATKAQEERHLVRVAKEKKEQEDNDARTKLLERQQHAFDEVNRHLRPQLDRVKSDADAVKGEIAQLELQKKQFVDEETFIRKYTRQAEANMKTYYDLLDKIKAAEDAHALAEAAAKAAKKD
jgi:membrane protein involved in colicin uptake